MKYPVAVAAILLLSLSACGQTGPLYLPGDPADVQSDLPSTLELPTGDEDDDDEQPRR